MIVYIYIIYILLCICFRGYSLLGVVGGGINQAFSSWLLLPSLAVQILGCSVEDSLTRTLAFCFVGEPPKSMENLVKGSSTAMNGCFLV